MQIYRCCEINCTWHVLMSQLLPAQDVAALDTSLLAHEEHLKYRYAQFMQTKAALEEAEGSLENFAKACCIF